MVIKKLSIVLITTLFLVVPPLRGVEAQTSNNEVLNLVLTFDGEIVNVEKATRQEGIYNSVHSNLTNPYTLVMTDGNSKTLFTTKFEPPGLIHADNFEDPGKSSFIESEEKSLSLALPVIHEAKKVQITDPKGFTVVDYPIAELVAGELKKPQPEEAKASNLVMLPGLAGGLVLITLMIYFLKKRRPPQVSIDTIV